MVQNTATRAHGWLLSDAPGAAHVFAGLIIGGTFAGIITLVVVAELLLMVVR